MIRFANLIDALDAAPDDQPFVTVWIDEDERETVTFSEFRRRARWEASALKRHGLTAGDRLVIIMPQGISAMTTFVAAMMLGAVPAFLAYPNFKVEPSKYRSGLAGVTATLHAQAVVIDQQFPEEMLECVALGPETKLLRAGGTNSSDENSPGLQKNVRRIEPDSLAFIQHSAGTTGLQKGVALTHAAVLRQLDHLAQALKIGGKTDCVYSWLPLYHDMGLIACFMLPLVCHVPVVMQSPIDWVMQPESMLQVVTECNCTLAWMPNFAFQFIPRRTPASGRVEVRCGSGARQQHERVPERFCDQQWRAAVVLRHGRKRFRGNPVGARIAGWSSEDVDRQPAIPQRTPGGYSG